MRRIYTKRRFPSRRRTRRKRTELPKKGPK